jgi:hypothetical protein
MPIVQRSEIDSKMFFFRPCMIDSKYIHKRSVKSNSISHEASSVRYLCSAFYSLYLPIVPQFSTRLVSKSKQMPSLQFLFSSLYQFSATERKIEARSRISLRCSSHHFRIHHKHQDTIFLIRQVASCPRQYLRDSAPQKAFTDASVCVASLIHIPNRIF